MYGVLVEWEKWLICALSRIDHEIGLTQPGHCLALFEWLQWISSVFTMGSKFHPNLSNLDSSFLYTVYALIITIEFRNIQFLKLH